MSLAGGGLLVSTELAYADLGTHHGRRLRGRAERRLLRLGLGDAAGLRLQIGRQRPVAVEVTERTQAGERRYEVAIPTPPDPRLAAVSRALLCWLIATLVTRAWRELRTKEPA